jgi:hypothetical protein
MTKKNNAIVLRITRRELATILAALRFHQDENLQGGRDIPDQSIKEIATDCGLLKPLSFEEVGKLCERLNLDEATPPAKGLVIEPPHKEGGSEPLFRIVYVIDVNAASPLKAAKQAHRIMSDPESQPPVLEVIDHRGKVVSIDLSKDRPA